MNEKLISQIEKLCEEKGVSVSSMLKGCGLSYNAFDNIKKGSKPSFDKIEKIADYFEVSTDYLLGRESVEGVSDAELKFALFGADSDATDEQLAEVKKYAAYIKQRYGKD